MTFGTSVSVTEVIGTLAGLLTISLGVGAMAYVLVRTRMRFVLEQQAQESLDRLNLALDLLEGLPRLAQPSDETVSARPPFEARYRFVYALAAGRIQLRRREPDDPNDALTRTFDTFIGRELEAAAAVRALGKARDDLDRLPSSGVARALEKGPEALSLTGLCEILDAHDALIAAFGEPSRAA
jgi:hypothetical protein